MKKLTSILIALSFLSCNSVTNHTFDKLLNRPESEYFKKYEMFNDNDYILTLTTIDTTDSYDIDKPTVILNFLKNNKNQVDTLINDSLFSRNPIVAEQDINIEFIDFNFDGEKDIVIPYGTDPRGNHGFHLYIVDEKSKNIQYLNGFQEIGNPKPDSTNYLIYSFVLSGPSFCKFYQINNKNELTDLGHYIEFYDFGINIDSLINNEIEIIKKEKLSPTKNIVHLADSTKNEDISNKYN